MGLQMSLTPSQLRATISGHVGWRAVPLICLTALVAYAASQTWLHELPIRVNNRNSDYPIFIALAQTACAIFLICFLTKALFGSEAVTLTATVLEVDFSIFGRILHKNHFDTRTIENLRYEEWSGRQYGRPSGIKFTSGSGSFMFARYVKASDGYELLDGMLSILNVPLNPTMESLTTKFDIE